MMLQRSSAESLDVIPASVQHHDRPAHRPSALPGCRNSVHLHLQVITLFTESVTDN